MKSKKEIKKAIATIYANENLTYGYREDVVDILKWVLSEVPTFDGLSGD